MSNSADQSYQHLALRISKMVDVGVHLDSIFAIEKEIWAKIDDCGEYKSFFFIAISLLSDFAAMIEDRPISPHEFQALTVWAKPFQAALNLMFKGSTGPALTELLSAIDVWLGIRKVAI